MTPCEFCNSLYGERARAEGRATTFQAVMAGGLERYMCWVIRTRRP